MPALRIAFFRSRAKLVMIELSWLARPALQAIS